MAESKDFDSAAPPKSVTDPEGVSGPVHPRHLYKAVAAPKDGEEPIGLVVAWKGKTPIYNEILQAADSDAEAAAVADGWALDPVLEPVKATKKKDA